MASAGDRGSVEAGHRLIGAGLPADTTARRPGLRYPLLDLLRVVAIGDIVSIHVADRYLIAGLGLPIFIVTAMALAFRKPALPAVGPMLGHRGQRVLLPWLAWSGFYAAGYALVAGMRPDVRIGQMFNGWMLITGPSVHLWFLPFIVVAEAVALLVLRRVRAVPVGLVVGGAALLGVVATGLTAELYDRWASVPVLADHARAATDPPWLSSAAGFRRTLWKSWLFGVAGVCFGVAVGRCLGGPSAWPRRLVLLVALALCGMYWLFAHIGWPSSSGSLPWQWWRQTGALLAVAVAVQVAVHHRPPGERTPWRDRLFSGPVWSGVRVAGLLTMGVYLLHPWVHSRLRDHLLPLLPPGLMDRAADGTRPMAYVALVWAVTAGAVVLLRRTPVRRVL